MVSVATLIYTPHEIYGEMFIVPIGALFAFTSVRANFPGAPVGFGMFNFSVVRFWFDSYRGKRLRRRNRYR
jgi:hypothetical protein